MNPLSNPSYLLPPLVVLAVSLILIVVIWRGSRWSFSSRIFCGLLLSVGLWGLLIFGMRSSPDVHSAVIWDRMVITVGYATYLLYYHFTLVYTNTSGQRRTLLAGYLLLALSFALSPTDLLVQEMRLEHYGYAPTMGPIFAPLILTGLFLIGRGVYNLVRRFNTSNSHDERNRTLYLIIAVLISVLGALLDAFSNLPPALIWCNLVFCIICSVAILRYRLLDIRIVIRKSLLYLLISVIVAVPYVGILLLLNQILKARIEPWWAHAFIVLLLAVFLRPLYSWAQQLIDRLFYHDRYDYLRALGSFSHKAQSVTDLEELGSTMVKLISGALRTSSVCLLLPSESKHGLVVVSSTGLKNPPSGVVLRNSCSLVKWLKRHGDILSNEQLNIVPQLQSFSLKEKNNLEHMGATLYVPIVARKGQLSGVLFLGEKLTQQSYSGEDKQLLMTVSSQMAMAIDNARLYKETRESEEKLRLMYDSMTEGVAVLDLHGDIVQVNRATLRMHGYDNKEELIGRSVFGLVAREDNAKATETLKRTLENKHTTNIELTFLKRDEGEFPAELSVGVLKDASDRPTGFVVVTEDVTERKQGEEACRAARVVENLRIFARRNKPKKECLNIDEILQKALEMRIYELKTSNIEVIIELVSTLPLVMADSQQIQQVFLNIIMNAEQAMTEANRGGKLVIKIKEAEGYIRITFTDDGPGISSENLDKLFDPFFTTRGEKDGTGLGLSICHGIVTEHGGKIYARSKPGKGATFFVELPVATE